MIFGVAGPKGPENLNSRDDSKHQCVVVGDSQTSSNIHLTILRLLDLYTYMYTHMYLSIFQNAEVSTL